MCKIFFLKVLTNQLSYGIIIIEREVKAMNSREQFEQKLINRYKELKQKEKTTLNLIIRGMYRDEMRKIEKIYFKNFKKVLTNS